MVIKRERWVDYLKKRAAEIAETYNKEMATNILNTTTYKAATEGNLGASIQRVGGEGGGEEEEAAIHNKKQSPFTVPSNFGNKLD